MSDSLHVVCPDCDGVNRLTGERLGGEEKCGLCGTELFSAKPVELDGQRFQKHVRRNDIPVLSFFRSHGFVGGSFAQLEEAL